MKHLLFSIILIFCPISLFADDTCKVPDNAVWSKETIRHKLPSGYSAGVLWFQALTHSNRHNEITDGEAMVLIDSEKVIEECPASSQKTIYTEDYESGSGPLPESSGGLYLRNPWFGGDDYHESMSNSNITNGNLVITVSKRPDRVAHWWTDRFVVDPACNYFVEIRFQIAGEASLQVGGDWWRDLYIGYNHYDETCQTSNNCEAWISDWFSSTYKKYVKVKTPLNDRCNMIQPPPPPEPTKPTIPYSILLDSEKK